MKSLLVLSLVCALFHAHAHKVSLRAVERMRDLQAGELVATPMSYLEHYYLLNINVGRYTTDEHSYTLLVDTGSSITFFGTNPARPYVASASQIKSDATFAQTFFTGEKVAGTWTEIAPGLVIPNTDFGVVTKAGTTSLTTTNEGIFALGRQGGAMVETGRTTCEACRTWMYSAVEEGLLWGNVITIDLAEPALTFGRVNLEHASGTPVYVPCVKQSHWAIRASIPQIGFAGLSVVDTGSPFLTLSDADMQALMRRIPGSKIEPVNSVLLVPVAHVLQPLTIIVHISQSVADAWLMQ
ncbi:uncharacterized protein L969DRAFT_52340 [Mixia osmundae IAM 14324]|uniref:Peptidase A1 domain-containing protein n=1 Tax=Mixia osmundae (strain CBS 9802 / IAM 14324 / JCM 22182 / KY 12970) TaxID=764103 RepID=G7E4T4_MIXOS|nr:uncharacterized protein L969DRAFT_52340 [Mixia osmundae IAM 14324]KEI37664.1 hypothetical protein L969DRAFT_52340 [Mixia osmundae IAM 14324]GAA97844.1 hypothetical protein E5Q_04523 [Mixia osmundae IAM 14324]